VRTWTPSGAIRSSRAIPSGTGATPGNVASIAHGPHVPPQPSSAQIAAGQLGVHAAAWHAPAAQPNEHLEGKVSNSQTPALHVPGGRDDRSVVASRQRGGGAIAQLQSASGGASIGAASGAASLAASLGGISWDRDPHAPSARARATIAEQDLPPECIAADHISFAIEQSRGRSARGVISTTAMGAPR
jgi:hypothetical protein